MFVWSFVTITEGLQKHQPEMYEACQRWFKAAGNAGKLKRTLSREYPEIKKISIDYALMEHAQNVLVANGAFEWDDLGSWTALGRHLKADPEGNCAVGEFIHVDGARNIIFDARTKDRRTPVAVVGLRDSNLVQSADEVQSIHERLLDDILSLNGKSSIFQMQRCAQTLAESGGPVLQPEKVLLEYQKMLQATIRERTSQIESGAIHPDEFIVHGARALLEMLRARGLVLIILSGTVEPEVKREAALLQLA